MNRFWNFSAGSLALSLGLLLAIPSRAGEIEEAVKEANALLSRGKAKEARVLLEPLAAKYPKSADLQYVLAQAAILERDLPGARKHLEQILRLDPKHDDARLVLSTIYRTEKKASKARKLLQDILKGNPKNSGALRGLGDLEVDAKRYEKAAGWYEKALAANPKDQKSLPLLASAWSRAAVSKRNGPKAKRDEYGGKAIEAYRRILKLKPDFDEIHYNLGTIAFLCEKYELAAQSLEEYLKKRPQDAKGLFNLAQVQEELKRNSEALATWRRFLEVASKDQAFRKDIPRAQSRIQALEKRAGR